MTLNEALADAQRVINNCKKPVLVVGVELHRFGLSDEVVKFAERNSIPMVGTLLGKSVVSEKHPLYLGIYEGAMCRDELRNYVEDSDCVIMLADKAPEWEAHAPAKYGGSPVSIMLYVANVDAMVKKAVQAGGKLTREVKDRFYGDRSGGITDPFGHHWHISTHVEDVSEKEMKRWMDAMMKSGS